MELEVGKKMVKDVKGDYLSHLVKKMACSSLNVYFQLR